MKNYFDEKGNYINCENLSLAEIYNRGAEENKKQGHWIDVPCERDLIYSTGIHYTCSVCNKYNCYGHPPFCMYCGAEMLMEADNDK